MAKARTVRVDVKPQLLRWARERARLEPEKLAERFPHLEEWEAGRVKPTLKQLENFASATAAPIGYMFLPEPPDEPLPVPDFRTLGDKPVRRPSPNLLDSIYEMQRRQAWLREERIEEGLRVAGICGLGNSRSAAGADRRCDASYAWSRGRLG